LRKTFLFSAIVTPGTLIRSEVCPFKNFLHYFLSNSAERPTSRSNSCSGLL